MALPQQKFREIAFQILYSSDFTPSVEEDMIPFMMQQFAVSKKTTREAQQYVFKVHAKLPEIDRLLASSSQAYAFDRIPRIERNVLRLGIFELLFSDEIPPKVAIAEAIRLCRKFATHEGATFVNAVLDSLYQAKLKAASPETSAIPPQSLSPIPETPEPSSPILKEVSEGTLA